MHNKVSAPWCSRTLCNSIPLSMDETVATVAFVSYDQDTKQCALSSSKEKSLWVGLEESGEPLTERTAG